MRRTPAHGVAIPIRTFALGNTRLAVDLDDARRLALARDLADRVLAAAGDAPVAVVTGAPEVADWARAHGALVVPDPGSLDAAATVGVETLAGLGCTRVVVAHADLPFAATFAPVLGDADRPVAVLVPCRHDDGTPVLSVPTAGVRFGFTYGPGSFRRHAAAARTAGLAVKVVRDPDLAFDVDTPDDLADLVRRAPHLVPAVRP